MPNRSAISKRLEVKAVFAPASSDSSYRWSRVDYSRAAGPISANSVVAVALAWIRRNICQGRLTVGTERNGKYTEEAGHPWLQLKRPNPYTSWAALIGSESDDTILFGNAYWLKSRDRAGDVLEYYWLPNWSVEVEDETNEQQIIETGNPIKQYRHSWGGKSRNYPPSEIIHFRAGKRDQHRPWMGLSDLWGQDRNAATVSASERYAVSVLLNAHAGKIIAPAEGEIEWKEPEAQALLNSIERGISGDNAGRITKSPYPINLLDAGMGPESMMLDRIANWPIAMILAAMGVNGKALDLPTSEATSTYANYGEALRSAYNSGIIPRQEAMADQFALSLPEDFPDNRADCAWWDRKHVEALKEDATEKASRARMIRQQGDLASINEARELIDLPPIEGGDKTPIEEQEEADAQALEIAQGQEQLQLEDQSGGDEWEEDEEEDDPTKALRIRLAGKPIGKPIGQAKPGKPGRTQRKRSDGPPVDKDKDGTVYDGTAREMAAPNRGPSAREQAAEHRAKKAPWGDQNRLGGMIEKAKKRAKASSKAAKKAIAAGDLPKAQRLTEQAIRHHEQSMRLMARHPAFTGGRGVAKVTTGKDYPTTAKAPESTAPKPIDHSQGGARAKQGIDKALSRAADKDASHGELEATVHKQTASLSTPDVQALAQEYTGVKPASRKKAMEALLEVVAGRKRMHEQIRVI